MRRPRSPGATNRLFVYNLSPTNKFGMGSLVYASQTGSSGQDTKILIVSPATEVKNYFRKFGAILAVKSVGIGRAGLHFGFVTFKDASSVQLARQDREHHLPSSDILCGEAKPHYRQSGYRRAHGIPSTLPRRTRKRLGYMQRHPPANPRPCVLADVVREAPRLLDFLPPDSWSALSASSSMLRQLIRRLTTVISTDTYDNLTTLCKGNWPQLALVVLRRPYCKPGFKIKGNIQLLSACNLSTDPQSDTTVLIVRPKSSRLQTDFARQRMLSATALAYFHRPQWSQLKHLRLCQCNLSAKGLSQLAAVSWPNLRTLLVRGKSLGYAGMTELAKGAWPELQSLNVSANELDTAAIAQLVQGAWPLLQCLDISLNPLVDAAAIKVLATSDWPCLADLNMSHIKLDVACVCELVQPRWAGLSKLNLHRTGVNAEAIAVFARTEWLWLCSLDLSDNELGPEAMAKLVLAPIPGLQALQLARNKLNAAAVKWLVKGSWPHLKALGLVDNYIDDAAMFHLSQGHWPLFRSLDLQQNKISALGLEFLTHSNWSIFHQLGLDRRAVSTETWTLLSLDPKSLQQAAMFSPMQHITAKRRVHEAATGQAGFWPCMTRVRFSSYVRCLKFQQPVKS